MSDENITALTARLKDLMEKATPGLWMISKGSAQYICTDGQWLASTMGVRGAQGDANALLITEAVNAVPTLLATLAEQAARIGDLTIEADVIGEFYRSQWEARALAAEQRADRAIEALRPFAEIDTGEVALKIDSDEIWVLQNGKRRLACLEHRHLRKARAVVEREGGNG